MSSTPNSNSFKEAGHEVLTHRVVNPASAVRSAGLLMLSPGNPGAAREVKRLVAEFRPEVAHVHNTWFSLSPSVLGALRSTGVPVVVTLHNFRLMCTNSLLFRDGHPCEECVGTHPWRGVLHRCYRDSVLASTAAAGAISCQSSSFRVVAERRPIPGAIAVLAKQIRRRRYSRGPDDYGIEFRRRPRPEGDAAG